MPQTRLEEVMRMMTEHRVRHARSWLTAACEGS